MATRRRPIGQCSKCKTIYPAETSEYFHEHKRRGRIELRAICKVCLIKQTGDYQKADRPKQRAYRKRYFANPEAREMMRASWRRFHAKPESKEYGRTLYKKLAATPEGRENFRAKVRLRRARINGCEHHHTKEDTRIAMEAQNGCCFYCDKDVRQEYTVDHLTPLARGGSDGPENIVIACASCNFHKADKTYEEFVAQKKHERKQWIAAREAMGGVALLWGARHSKKE